MDGVNAAIDEIERYTYTSDGGLAEWLKEGALTANFEEMVERLSRLIE
jgi:hypothetical protein